MTGMWQGFCWSARGLRRDSGAFLLLALASTFYAFFYPYP
jgi:hypothetical protein